MLENAHRHTVPALEKLFRELVFNTEVINLWWNPQMDFQVLDNTIAHMYQGTARAETYSLVRDEYEDENGRNRWTERPVKFTPTFRIQSPHLNGTRPDDLKAYTKVLDCGLHQEEKYSSWVYQGCPCAFGNIDIAALLNAFCRQIGLTARKGDWGCVRSYFRYDDLLCTMLGTDRLISILPSMKSAGGSEAFYQGLGKPDMELDDIAMGYNVGDVVGINLIFDQLMASHDKRFVGSSLNAYQMYDRKADERRCRSSKLHVATRRLPQRQVGDCHGIPLFEDNPKDFKKLPFLRDPAHPDPLAKLLSDASHINSDYLDLDGVRLYAWEHDERVAAMRATKGDPKPLPSEQVLYKSELTARLGYVPYYGLTPDQQAVMLRTLDPTRLALPATMVLQRPDVKYQEPVVRAGSSHAEALIEILHSARAASLASLPGFAAGPGSRYGLPVWLGRVPGQDLDGSQTTLQAFQIPHPGADASLLSGSELREGLGRAPAPVGVIPSGDDMIMAAIRATGISNVWKALPIVRRNLDSVVREELASIARGGRPYLVDDTDVFDRDGRQYRKLLEAGESYNRPTVFEYYRVGENGDWISAATVTKQALEEKFPADQDDNQDFEGGKVVGWATVENLHRLKKDKWIDRKLEEQSRARRKNFRKAERK